VIWKKIVEVEEKGDKEGDSTKWNNGDRKTTMKVVLSHKDAGVL